MSSDFSSNFLQFNFAMEIGTKHSVYWFDKFYLDCDKLMLYRDGEPVTLPPRVVKTLAVLVEKSGSILSKNELMDSVWEDSIVEEANLSQNLYLLRKTLGSKPDGTPYIETLRRRGYRFTADNVVIETAPPQPGENPSQPPTQTSIPPRYAVERHGNVVALLDWREADEGSKVIPENAIPAVAKAEDHPRSSKLRIWGGIAAVLGAVALGVGFWMNSPNAAVQIEEPRAAAIEIVALTNGEDVNQATISRDGKYFTYHEQDGEFARLVVQQTGQSKPLEVLPRAHSTLSGKTFSPDSQYIYYMASEQGAGHSSIYRVPTLGGVRTKVIEHASSHAAFSPDGKSIVFQRTDRSMNSSIVIAGSDGTGEKTVLTRSGEEAITGSPAWSPDGNTIAFGMLRQGKNERGHCELKALDLNTSEVRPLSDEKWDNCYRIEWRRDGKGIVFVGTKFGDGSTIRRDQVYHLTLADRSTRRLTTDSSRYQAESLGITDSNQVICVPFNRSSQLWVMSPDGSSKTATTLTNGSSDGRAGLVPLPDGRIAFTARVSENLGAWVVDSDGSNRRQFITDPPIIEELRATQDGKYFFFASIKDDRSHIYRVDADGSNLKQLTTGDTYEADSSPSPDGKWIVFDSMPVAKHEEQRLWRISIEGGAPTKISEMKCGIPNYSPSGKYISCVADNNLLVVSAEDGTLVHTFPALRLSFLNIGARWTPDEKALVYIASQKGTTNLWVQTLDGKPPRPLTDFPNGAIYNFAYSHDGSKLFLARGFQIRDAILISGF